MNNGFTRVNRFLAAITPGETAYRSKQITTNLNELERQIKMKTTLAVGMLYPSVHSGEQNGSRL